MRKFGIIHARYWAWALENKLSEEDRTIGAYLLSCDHGNSIGCFKCPPAYVADDLGYGIDTVSIRYKYLSQKDFLLYCDTSKIVFLPQYLRWNPLQNKNHAIGSLKILRELPSSFSLLEELMEALNNYACNFVKKEQFKDLFDTLWHRVSIPYAIPYRNKDKDKDKDIQEDTSVSSSPELSLDSVGEAESVLSISLIKRDGEFKVFQKDVDDWQDIFPGVEVLAELKKIKLWNNDNPKKRKTKDGIRGHISRWLSKAQNKNHVPGNSTRKINKEKILESFRQKTTDALHKYHAAGNVYAYEILRERGKLHA